MNTADKINFKILMSHFRQFVFLTIASFFFLATESTAREKPNQKSNETNLLDISPALWKKKDTLYLARRILDLEHDSTWRIAKDEHNNTVLQRRFHKNLDSIETIDLILDEEVEENALDEIRVNFRISNKGSSGLSLSRTFALLSQSFKTNPRFSNALPGTPFHEYSHIAAGSPYHRYSYESANKFVGSVFSKSQGKTFLRYKIGEFLRQAFFRGKISYLKEIVIFFPSSLVEIDQVRLVGSIQFQKRKEEKVIRFESIDTPSTWKKTSSLHRLKHKLGLATNENWQYDQAENIATLKNSLHIDLHPVSAMSIVLNEKLLEDKDLHCRIRIGFKKKLALSETINCKNLHWETTTVNGKYILRVPLYDLVQRKYREGKEKVYLEEVVISLPGQATYYIKNKLWKAISFYVFEEYTYEIRSRGEEVEEIRAKCPRIIWWSSISCEIKKEYWEGSVMLKSETPYVDGKESGDKVSWHRNGRIESVEGYEDGMESGLHIFWYANGQKRAQGQYQHGKRDGSWIEWSKDGTGSSGNYKNGKWEE